jgi:hypothetical protein
MVQDKMGSHTEVISYKTGPNFIFHLKGNSSDYGVLS